MIEPFLYVISQQSQVAIMKIEKKNLKWNYLNNTEATEVDEGNEENWEEPPKNEDKKWNSDNSGNRKICKHVTDGKGRDIIRATAHRAADNLATGIPNSCYLCPKDRLCLMCLQELIVEHLRLTLIIKEARRRNANAHETIV